MICGGLSAPLRLPPSVFYGISHFYVGCGRLAAPFFVKLTDLSTKYADLSILFGGFVYNSYLCGGV